MPQLVDSTGPFGNKIRSKLQVKDVQPDDLALLKRVVDTAKEYFKDPKRFNRAVQEAIGDGGDGEKGLRRLASTSSKQVTNCSSTRTYGFSFMVRTGRVIQKPRFIPEP